MNVFDRGVVTSMYKVVYKEYRSAANFTFVDADFDDIVLLDSAAVLLQDGVDGLPNYRGSRLNILIPKILQDEVLNATEDEFNKKGE